MLEQLMQVVRDASAHPLKAVGSLSMLTDNQRRVLPDPTENLNWNDFRGTIHEIFDDNAIEDPNRPCVVETGGNNDGERVFTYRDIQEASNIVAHYLVSRGVIRGDVVMIYAYRGVDLVVAIMGILKAGAIFSVIGKPR